MGQPEDEAKTQEHQPLCLFYYPRAEIDREGNPIETYLSSTQRSLPSKTQKLAEGQKPTKLSPWKLPPSRRIHVREPSSSDETAGQVARAQRSLLRGVGRKPNGIPKKRRLGRGKRKAVHHLTSFLLASEQINPAPEQDPPPLIHVLNTVTDAWPSVNKNLQFLGEYDSANQETNQRIATNNSTQQRRRSVPEEIIRKFSVSNERTSESEANVTMPEITPPSSKENEEVKASVTKSQRHQEEDRQGVVKLKSDVFSRKVEENWPVTRGLRSFTLVEDPNIVRSAEEGSSDSDSDASGLERYNTIKRAPLRRGSVVTESTETQHHGSDRPSQNDYYREGQGILKINAAEKSCQTGECTCRMSSGTTPSAQEESESAETSETISSPRFCTKPLSSSENQSSDSESINCTCAEMASSKETSTDPNHSGKSTLSQTVSDKSTSTQDSTASINSVSSRGTTITAATDSSSTEVDPRTSAKETTTSPDHTPRFPPKRRPPDRRPDDEGNAGNSGTRHSKNCPQHRPPRQSREPGNGGRASHQKVQESQLPVEKPAEEKNLTAGKDENNQTNRTYEWAQLSKEELNLIQQQRHSRFIENNRNLSSPTSMKFSGLAGKVSVCTSTGSSYQDTGNLKELPLMVPRYSALPRTMSMVVNSSSFEASQYSDSDCQSLADSLEDGQNGNEQQYFDTKNELKPVRGDVKQALLNRNKKSKSKEPRGRAYFFALDEKGETELVTNIHKIPELPKKLKNKIHERHISICKSHETLPAKEISKPKERQRLIKKKSSVSKLAPKKLEPVSKKTSLAPLELKKTLNNATSRLSNSKLVVENDDKKDKNSPKFPSKIPTPIHSERSSNEKRKEYEKSRDKNRALDLKTNETEKTPRKPQAVIHPSQPVEAGEPHKKLDLEEINKNRLSLISSLESTALVLKAQQNTLKQLNKPQPAMKRSSKFQQRFEVIPEERSSSLTSSADEHHSEKNRRRSLPVKLSEPVTSPTFLTPGGEGGKSFRRYSLGSLSNYVIAKLMGRPLQAIPCVQRGPNNENQQIIIFSPKNPTGQNSSKGRDALLAMNRDDFNRLSKGWMNFYLLKESSESDNEEVDFNSNENQETSASNTTPQEDGPQTLLDPNKLVCRIPSMENDPTTTSGSGTDETSLSKSQIQENCSVDLAKFSKSYSLLLKNPMTNCFQLQECPSDGTEQQMDEFETIDPDTDLRRTLNLIAEEPEITHEGLIQKQPSEELASGKLLENINYNSQKDTRTEISNELNEKLTQKFNYDIKTENLEETKQSSTPTRKLTKEASTSTEKNYELKAKRTEQSIKLSAPIKLGSSNTVLTTKKLIKVSPRKNSSRTCSLPELNVEKSRKSTPIKTQSFVESLPAIPIDSSDSEDTDTDSTVYLDLPSPQMPKLPLEDCCDFYSTDSDSAQVQEKAPKEKSYVPLRRRPLPFRPKNRFAFHESVHGKKPGWSVTVEGTLEFPHRTPDVQMSLSFPGEGGPPLVSQSDSGFVEERSTKPRPSSKQKQQWTVTVNNPERGKDQHREKYQLPNLCQPQTMRNRTRGAKDQTSRSTELEEIGRRLSTIWPKVQEVIESELKTITKEFIIQEEPLLSVEGRAMSFETKSRAPKMSERDLTRNTTRRDQSTKMYSAASTNRQQKK